MPLFNILTGLNRLNTILDNVNASEIPECDLHMGNIQNTLKYIATNHNIFKNVPLIYECIAAITKKNFSYNKQISLSGNISHLQNNGILKDLDKKLIKSFFNEKQKNNALGLLQYINRIKIKTHQITQNKYADLLTDEIKNLYSYSNENILSIKDLGQKSSYLRATLDMLKSFKINLKEIKSKPILSLGSDALDPVNIQETYQSMLLCVKDFFTQLNTKKRFAKMDIAFFDNTDKFNIVQIHRIIDNYAKKCYGDRNDKSEDNIKLTFENYINEYTNDPATKNYLNKVIDYIKVKVQDI